MYSSKLKGQIFIFLSLLVGFAAAIGVSVWGATTISTSVTTGAHVYATSTVQATGSLIGYGNLFVGGTSTATVTGFNLGGAAGTHADAYISGGLGVANATTTDGDFVVGNDFYVYSNGRVGVATSVPAVVFSTVGDGYFTGGLGVGVATSTAGAVETSGKLYVGTTLRAAGTGTSSVAGALQVDSHARITGNLQVGNSGKSISQVLFSGTCSVNPPALQAMGGDPAGDTAIGDKGHASCTDATGVTTSDVVFVDNYPAGWNNDVFIVNASSTANDTINFVFKNTSTTTAINIGAVNIPWFAIK